MDDLPSNSPINEFLRNNKYSVENNSINDSKRLMRIGVIGAASIFRNRWLNILEAHNAVTLVGVARRELDKNEKRFEQRLGYF